MAGTRCQYELLTKPRLLQLQQASGLGGSLIGWPRARVYLNKDLPQDGKLTPRQTAILAWLQGEIRHTYQN